MCGSLKDCNLVGIDHSFSFPLRYFEVHHLPPDWTSFLDDFQQHWPTDDDHMHVVLSVTAYMARVLNGRAIAVGGA
jgi:hypothetical protein